MQWMYSRIPVTQSSGAANTGHYQDIFFIDHYLIKWIKTLDYYSIFYFSLIVFILKIVFE